MVQHSIRDPSQPLTHRTHKHQEVFIGYVTKFGEFVSQEYITRRNYEHSRRGWIPWRWESTVTYLVQTLAWVFLSLQPLLKCIFTHTPSLNSPNGDKGNQKPLIHCVCRGSARAVMDIQSQSKLLLITYYVPDAMSVAITLNPLFLQTPCPCHMPGIGWGIKPCTKQSSYSPGAYM